jgi:hypothetical protein
MNGKGTKNNQLAFAVAAAISAGALAGTTTVAMAKDQPPGKTSGTYVAGDFHNHTTCSDGSISMQKLVRKATGTADSGEADGFGLDWFVQAGHGGNGNRNCTLTEDASLDTPVYPYTGQGPTTTWQNTAGPNGPIQPKGLASGTAPNQNMWRWQSIQEFQYPLIEYLKAYKERPLFLGIESVVAGHEHSSMSIITGQMPAALDYTTLPTAPVSTPGASRYTAIGNANALAKWEYCFDRGDTDTSRGNTTVGGTVGNNWNCSVPGSLNAADVSWNVTAQKLIPAGGAGSGVMGHNKTIEALKWMVANAPNGSYYVPAHLERAGPFNPDGNNGYNIEHLRDFNNAAPNSAFGFETQPGHGASSDRGEYAVKRNNIAGVLVDSVGGTTYGGTGVYGAQVGGVWDALLGEGRNWWFFASSDWHNRGSFGPDDRRTNQDFFPGEYQRNYTMVRTDKQDQQLTPQAIVDGLRSGNNFAASGQLIDRLSFVACIGNPAKHGRSESAVEALAAKAAADNTDINFEGCATMGQKLQVEPGVDVIVAVVVRDPAGTNNSPYTFPNPSLLQVGITQPINEPLLDHIDVIRGLVSGYRKPGSANYSGEWPRNTTWLRADGTTADLSVVPDAAKNTTAAVINVFSNNNWQSRHDEYLTMSFRIPAVSASQYVRLRGTNMPPAVPYETDANGNPLADVYTNASNRNMLSIPCTTPHSANSQFDGCPDHLTTATSTAGSAYVSPIVGQTAVAYDVAAWSDLWFYSNPIYMEVAGGVQVAGVK